MIRFYRNFIALSLLLLIVSVGFCQTDSRARLAQALEKNSNYEQSLEIYLELFKEGKREFGVIRGIQKAYTSLNRYPEFITFQKNLLLQHPGNINYQTELGRAYFLNQQKTEAMQEWKSILNKHKNNNSAYYLVGRTMTELRLLDEAVEIYQLALKNVKQKDNFFREIAAVRRAQLNYEQATEYLLEYYRANPKQKSYVRSQLTTMAKDDEAARRILSAIKIFSKTYPKSTTFEEFRALLHTRLGQFRQALNIYQKLKKVKLYLQFANDATTEKAYPYGVESLQMALIPKQQAAKKNDIYLLLAKTHHAWAENLRTKNEPESAQQQIAFAQDILSALATQDKDTRNRWLSMELSADILVSYFQDNQAAIDKYQQILSDCSMIMITERVRLKLAEIYLKENNLPEATNQYQKIRVDKFHPIALFHLAYIQYYQGKFSTAQKQFQDLQNTLSAKDTLTNNVLKQLFFIESFKTDSIRLAQFSHAQLLQRQNHFVQAAAQFNQIFQQNNTLSVKAGLSASVLFRQIGKLKDADLILTELVNRYPQADEVDLGLLLLAELKTRQNNTADAESLYLELISKYPDSFYVDRARENIRTLKSSEGYSEQ